jgi:hypothetical protein
MTRSELVDRLHSCAPTLTHDDAKSVVDPYEGILPVREDVQWRWPHCDYRIPRRALHNSMVASSRGYALHPYVRYCGRCLSRGYQATLHQLVGIATCPIHEEPLVSACRVYRYEIPLRLNALLLDSPFSCPNCRSPLAANRPSMARR